MNVLVLGATSGIARALCDLMAGRGHRLVLAGRDMAELQILAEDLRIRHQVPVAVEHLDVLEFDSHPGLFRRCVDHFQGALDVVVCCVGYMVGNGIATSYPAELRKVIDTNLTGVASLLELAARYFEERRRGTIVAISSVAGDRGRQSNYAYGAAKAGLTTYLQGLRNRLHRSGVKVLTVKPGFVDTPMTRGIVDPRLPLLATPERVAADIYRALVKGRSVLYTPRYWQGIMACIRAIPEPLFKRMSV